MPNDDDMKRFGELLRSRRLQLGMTQAGVATSAGLATTYYSDLERAYAKPGKSPIRPSDINIESLAATLKLPKATLNAAMGRAELPSDVIERINAEHQELEQLEDTGQYIARYRELSPRNQKIVNRLIKELGEADEDN